MERVDNVWTEKCNSIATDEHPERTNMPFLLSILLHYPANHDGSGQAFRQGFCFGFFTALFNMSYKEMFTSSAPSNTFMCILWMSNTLEIYFLAALLGLVDEQQKVRTITALALAALAEAATPYGIESFDSVLKPLWKGIRQHRGKVTFLKNVSHSLVESLGFSRNYRNLNTYRASNKYR